MNIEDTICAPATVPGTGAIAIIRMSGKDSFRIADKVVSCKGSTISETEGYKLRYGVALEADGTDLDTVLVSVFRSPHSYTGEDSVEISCHSSKYVVERLLQRLVDSGARPAGPGEFTQRAFVNGKMDLAQAEAVADVISSQNAAAHRVAYSQLKGGFSKELKSLRDELLKMTSLLELELDFSEEDVEFASRRELSALLDGALRHIHSLTDSFRYGNALRNGVPVAIVGAVNAGKSTLLNALVGDDRAIVSDIAGTTRDTVEETMTIDGTLFRFIDTAGLRETSDEVEKIGISRFDPHTGEPLSVGENYSSFFGKAMCSFAAKDKRICAITAAMTLGTGLEEFSTRYPERFFDVGIAEEHAVTFAIRASTIACSFFASSYSLFSERSPNERATRIFSETSLRRTVLSWTSSSSSALSPLSVTTIFFSI